MVLLLFARLQAFQQDSFIGLITLKTSDMGDGDVETTEHQCLDSHQKILVNRAYCPQPEDSGTYQQRNQVINADILHLVPDATVS